MAHPMFTVPTESSQSQQKKKAQVHLLPCRIHHDGAVGSTETYWNPVEGEDGQKTAYFRGRKLHGKTMRLPEGYRGAVVEKGEPGVDRDVEVQKEEEEEEEEGNPLEEVGALHGKAAFDEVVVWGHENIADSAADPYVRGVEEWISLAEQIHAYPAEQGVASK